MTHTKTQTKYISTIEGIEKSVITNYFTNINQEDFQATATLFTQEGKLLAPFEKPIVGRKAIASYLAKEAQGMEAGTIVPVPDDYEPTGGVTELLSQVESMEFEQQITFLRDAVIKAGAEPKSGAQV